MNVAKGGDRASNWAGVFACWRVTVERTGGECHLQRIQGQIRALKTRQIREATFLSLSSKLVGSGGGLTPYQRIWRRVAMARIVRCGEKVLCKTTYYCADG